LPADGLLLVLVRSCKQARDTKISSLEDEVVSLKERLGTNQIQV
jgi:hypothetical protein